MDWPRPCLSDSSLLQDNVAFVLCLDTLGNSDNLHLHVSKPPKEGSPQHALLKELEMVRSLEIMQPSLLLEVCTGSKLKPEPGPYPSGTVKFRARTRPEIPPPPSAPQRKKKKKRKKAAFHDCMQRDGLIKALPFHKHYQLGKFVNIRCSGRIHSAEFMNLYG